MKWTPDPAGEATKRQDGGSDEKREEASLLMFKGVTDNKGPVWVERLAPLHALPMGAHVTYGPALWADSAAGMETRIDWAGDARRGLAGGTQGTTGGSRRRIQGQAWIRQAGAGGAGGERNARALTEVPGNQRATPNSQFHQSVGRNGTALRRRPVAEGGRATKTREYDLLRAGDPGRQRPIPAIVSIVLHDCLAFCWDGRENKENGEKTRAQRGGGYPHSPQPPG